MIDATLKDQLLEEIERLSPEQLARVYQYAQTLAPPPMRRGTTVDELMSLAGSIDDESARQMTAAIEEACERVDPSEW
ncbi:MAG TPA: hypothetical protein VI942_06315 [Thermoanaerobaculia bacterium]|nr:hypothetical protein [Thermoanaerobaculia bacterium]